MLKNLGVLHSYLIIVVGPTAVGKTNFSIKLAQHFDAEVISCDSRQLYKEMSIGTAKPSILEMEGVPHHFIDSHSINELYSAGDYEREVAVFLNDYFKRKKIALLVGGTGLFVRAITHGLDEMPAAPIEIRELLMSRLSSEGLSLLQDELKKLDFETYQKIDIQNTQRVVRALEVCLSTGEPFSKLQNNPRKHNNFSIIKIGLELPREQLYERINLRIDQMLANGLVEEVKTLTPFEKKNALQTVGYKEVFAYLKGDCDYNTMVLQLKQNTRRYAKRQMTWFKNKDTFEWFHPNDMENVLSYINSMMV